MTGDKEDDDIIDELLDDSSKDDAISRGVTKDDLVPVDDSGIPFTPIKTWTTKDGETIPVEEIDDSHLANIINYLEKKDKTESPAYKTMKWEVKRRKMSLDIDVEKKRLKRAAARGETWKPAKPRSMFPGEKSYDDLTDKELDEIETKLKEIEVPVTVDSYIEVTTPYITDKEGKIIGNINKGFRVLHEYEVDVTNSIIYVIAGKDENSGKIKDMLCNNELMFDEVKQKADELGVEIEIPVEGALARTLEILKKKADDFDTIAQMFRVFINKNTHINVHDAMSAFPLTGECFEKISSVDKASKFLEIAGKIISGESINDENDKKTGDS